MAMAQWVNRLRNNIFVNPPPLPLSCKVRKHRATVIISRAGRFICVM